ncbi:unnamed protein product [Caenorhabditis sp. 36 PRJEB53466]|nr:unnamed protein product [Caenorhabditis sp. 36 PRJEB53466]
MSRTPLHVDSYEGNDTVGSEIARFVVLYGKASTRKHKIWEGDGILVCCADSAVLKSEDERDVICRSSALKNLDQLEDGRVVNIGSWSVEIQERIATKKPVLQAPLRPSGNSFNSPFRSASKIAEKSPEFSSIPKESLKNSENASLKRVLPLPISTPSSQILSMPKRATFVPPLLSATSSSEVQEKLEPFVLNESDILARKTAHAVIVDQRFARHLRDHQKHGIQFIFDRLKNETGGAILADDMGLGKSIQTMAATWALLKGAKSGANLAATCLIVVPSSLVNNWKAEFDKWWRLMRFPAVLAQTARDIHGYRASVKTMPYLVISYDMAQRHVEKLKECRFDVIVCDEGHKLKNVDGKLRKALDSLEIPRRLILTGTPMQNDFDEFYSLLDFVRPNQFGTLAQFRKMCSEDPEELNERIDECMLRRTAADVNMRHLPEKHEYILFCKASAIQKQIHSEICDYMTGDPLSLIFFARQLANHPKLLYDNLREKHEKSNQKHSALLLAFDGATMPRGGVKESGKLTALVDMLKCFRMLGECAVVVSNYIETLDMIEQLCKYLEFHVFRLDGKTQVQERQKSVRHFNDQHDASNVFLLSTKAGGVGLNLIGASRLILFDSDWNPANDRQAMARIWRDGQVRPCHIYRLITTGTIEEKMLQRQIKKTGLGCVIDAIEVGDSVSTFTDEELKDIFTFIGDTECNTHDLCECPCDGCGMLENEMENEEEEGEEEVKKISDSDDDEDVDDEQIEADQTVEEGKLEREEEEEEKEDEIVEDSAEEKQESPQDGVEKIDGKEENKEERTSASLAELSRWRHFSPRYPDTWHHLMTTAGLSQMETDVHLTFAFYQQSQY